MNERNLIGKGYDLYGSAVSMRALDFHTGFQNLICSKTPLELLICSTHRKYSTKVILTKQVIVKQKQEVPLPG